MQRFISRELHYTPSEDVIAKFSDNSLGISGIPDDTTADKKLRNRYRAMAVCVAKSPVLMDPFILNHGLLNGLSDDAGKTRRSIREHRIGEIPEHADVPKLLTLWHVTTEAKIAEYRACQDIQRKRKFADKAQCNFLCIDAFINSNGKTSRLLHNNICSQIGIPWKLFDDLKLVAEKERLAVYRQKVFLPNLPQMLEQAAVL